MSKKIRIKRARDQETSTGNGELRDLAQAAADLVGGRVLTDEQKRALEALEAEEKRKREIEKKLVDELTLEEREVVLVAKNRDRAKEYDKAARAHQEELMRELAREGREHGYAIEVTDPHDGTTLKGTFNKPKPGTQIDTDKLKASLPAKVWEAITRSQVDQELLEDAIAKGLISKQQMEEATEETKPAAPHIRITRRGAKQ